MAGREDSTRSHRFAGRGDAALVTLVMKPAPALLLALLPLAAPAEDRFLGPVPEPAALAVQRDAPYRAGPALVMDVYRPAGIATPLPALVLVNGIGAGWMRGHPQYTGWAQAAAARGMAGITL